MTASRGGRCRRAVHEAGETIAAIQGDQLAVDIRAPVTTRPHPPDQRFLYSEGSRAPEPVGVPAPQVVADGQEVLLVPPDRFVVDLLPGVVAAPRRHGAERPDGEVKIVGPERGAVDEIRPVPAEAALRGDLADRVHAGFRAAEREVADVHERLDGFELDGERQGVAQRPVGVREAAEQVGMLVVVGGADDTAVAGQDLHLGDGFVRHAAAQRGGLDAEPGDRATQGYRLELRHHQRHQLMPERGVAQVLVGGHAPDPRGPGGGINAQHVAERGNVQAPVRLSGFLRGSSRAVVAEPEQVGRALGQPHRRPRGQGRVGLAQPGHLDLMRAGGHAGIHHGHPSGLTAVTHYGNGRERANEQDPY